MIFIPLLYFILANSFLVLITKKKFGITIPFTIMFTSIILYLSAFLFNTFTIGYIIDLIIIPLVLLYLIKNKNNKIIINEFKKNYFSNGLIITVIVGCFFFIYDYKRIFLVWDELSHWGIMVKNLLRFNTFYSGFNSTMMYHKDYPPIMSIFEMLCIKLSGGKYNESLIAQSVHMFNSLLLLPAISEIKETKKIKLLFYTILIIIMYMLLVLYFDPSGVMNSIYIDYSIATICALGLFYIFYNKLFDNYDNNILLLILMVFLILSKDVGLPLYAVLLFSVVLKMIFSIKDYNKKSLIINIIIFIIIPLLFLLSWKIYIKPYNIIPEFDLGEVNTELLRSVVFAGRDDGVQYYYDYTRKTNMTSGSIQMTYLSGSIVLFVLLYLIIKKYKINSKDSTVVFSSLLVCHIGYYFMFLILVTLAIHNNNKPFIGSLLRYLDTCILIEYISVFMIFLYKNFSLNKNIAKTLFIVLALLLCIQNSSRLSLIYPLFRSSPSGHVGFQQQASYLKSKIPENSNVFFLSAEDNVGYHSFLQYYSDPIKLNKEYYSYVLHNDIWINNFNVIKDYMKDYDYLFLINYTQDFEKRYSSLFDELKDYSIYKIVIDNNEIKFVLIS